MTTYTSILRKAKSNSKMLIQICKKHLEYLKSLKLNELTALAIYVKGGLMHFKYSAYTTRTLETTSILNGLRKYLEQIIKSAPPLDKKIHVFRGTIVNQNRRLYKGEIISDYPVSSTTMYHPTAIEWAIERLFQEIHVTKGTKNFERTINLFVYEIPKGSQISLCIGCHNLICGKNKMNFIQNSVLRKLKNQITTQGEVIISHPYWRITNIDTLTIGDITNVNQYGKGWYSNIFQGKVPAGFQFNVVHLSFVSEEKFISHVSSKHSLNYIKNEDIPNKKYWGNFKKT